MGHVDPGECLEQLPGEMIAGTAARRGETDFPRLCPSQRDQIANVIGRRVGCGNHQHRRVADKSQRGEFLHGVIAELAVNARVDRVRADGAQYQGVAIGQAFGGTLGANGAAGTGDVVDDQRLAQRQPQALRKLTPDDVGRGAGSGRHNQLDGFVRVRLCGHRERHRESAAGSERAKQVHV